MQWPKANSRAALLLEIIPLDLAKKIYRGI
jgi:hypothetical protein